MVYQTASKILSSLELRDYLVDKIHVCCIVVFLRKVQICSPELRPKREKQIGRHLS